MQYKFSVYNTYITHDTIVQTVMIDDDYFWSTIYNMHVLIGKSIRLAVATRFVRKQMGLGPLSLSWAQEMLWVRQERSHACLHGWCSYHPATIQINSFYLTIHLYIYGFLSILVRHQLLFETFQTLVLHLKSVLQAHAMACAECTTSPASVNEPGVHIVLGHPWMDLSGLGNYNMEHHCEVCWNKAGQMKEVKSRNLKKVRVGKDWYSKGWGKQSHIDPKQIKTRTYVTYGYIWHIMVPYIWMQYSNANMKANRCPNCHTLRTAKQTIRLCPASYLRAIPHTWPGATPWKAHRSTRRK